MHTRPVGGSLVCLPALTLGRWGESAAGALDPANSSSPPPTHPSPPAPPPRPMSQYYQRLGGNWMEFREEQQVRLKGLLGLRD